MGPWVSAGGSLINRANNRLSNVIIVQLFAHSDLAHFIIKNFFISRATISGLPVVSSAAA